MPTILQRKMMREMETKDLFRQAQSCAFEYADQHRERPVFPTDEAIASLNVFDEPMPEKSADPSDVLKMLHDYGSPSTVSQMGGRYFGFVNGGIIPASLAARWLSDFWDQNSALYVMSPLASKLEVICEAWLKDLFGLPERVVAGFVSGSSMAIFCGLAAARYRVLKDRGWDINDRGLRGAPNVRIVAGRQAHGAVAKAVALLGFGTGNIEWVEADAQGRMMTSRVPELDERTVLILQAGHVSSGAFDPFEPICEKARDAGAWVHIDGAFGLWVAGSNTLNYLTKGMEKANSWSVDGHKTLNTPYDSGVVLCDDREALVNALQASGSYITYSENRDGMLTTPEMSRRARAVDLWAALKYLGKEGVDALVTGLHENAVQLGRKLASEGFQILNDVVFNQVVVACDSDDITNRTIHHIQQSGDCWVGGAVWNGKAVIRVSVCSWATTEADIAHSIRGFSAARDMAVASLNSP